MTRKAGPDAPGVIDAAKAREGSPFLTTKQAAFYLGVSPRTLQDMRTDGRGPPYHRHGRSVRYHASELIEWATGDPIIGKRA
ncbi:helix-turn-helix domain-containing protein [Sphingomonas colocasiae]|uniref:Helix-turn-helix domain-containing protein n=1 Tax=Sphingomonas colocasiae TaxID=1848973 RepID=A0ABS7PII2_9SPHN|nr:helix-turn-helix domain-containing protein [Sphingomonas colocasiae]MBY8821058.1 helix-turn-helix domain-containing protein [Sphingomonas colocasiae]